MTCENHCRSDRISSLRSVARIQTGLYSWDISQLQNKRKQPCRSVCTLLRQVAATKFESEPIRVRQLFSRHVKCELVHVSPLPNSLAYTEQVTCRTGSADEATCRIVSRPLEFLISNLFTVSFRMSLRWPIHIINPVDETKLSCYTSHRRSTTVSLNLPLFRVSAL